MLERIAAMVVFNILISLVGVGLAVAGCLAIVSLTNKYHD